MRYNIKAMGGMVGGCCGGSEFRPPTRYAELSPEEAYMLKKQHDLRVFVLSCEDVKQAFLVNLHFGTITEDEFVETLVSLKLLRTDKPKRSLQWLKVYSKLKISADDGGEVFDLCSIMISLYFLTSNKPSVKAKYISELFLPLNETLKSQKCLSRLDLMRIFITFISVSLDILPFYSFDYPDPSKEHFKQLLYHWNASKQLLLEHIIDDVSGITS